MQRHEIANLKAGDVVAVMPYTSRSPHSLYHLNKVVLKVNGHGHISVGRPGGTQVLWTFDKHGQDRSAGKFHGAMLCNNDVAKTHNDAANAQKEVNLLVGEIQSLLTSCKNGYGNYRINDEIKQRIIAKVNEI